MTTSRYLTCAETARLVRKALKASFPGIKFSVRSKTYSGGASIRVTWTDGPTAKQVEQITNVYASKSFDGMIDMGCYWDSWLMPDGTATMARGSGTEGSRGYITAIDCPKPHPDAELVHFGSNYVSAYREYSVDFLTAMAEKVSRRYGLPVPKVHDSEYGGAYLDRAAMYTPVSGPYTLNDLIYREMA